MTREEALALMRRASSWRTICEVHREIFDIGSELPEPHKTKIRDLTIEAFIMGKKMDEKLKEYKSDWAEGVYELNIDRRSDSARRKCESP